MIVRRKVIDSHTHVGKWKWYDKTIRVFQPEFLTPKDYVNFLMRYNIEKAVVVPNYTYDKSLIYRNNRIVLQTVEDNPNRVVGGLWIDPSPNAHESSMHVLESTSIRGIKVLKFTPNQWRGFNINPESWNEETKSIFQSIIEATIKNKLILQFHTGRGKSDPCKFDSFIDKYGDNLKIHFVHMGGVTHVHLRFIPTFIGWLKKGLQLYTDASWARGFAPRWLVRELKKINGFDHFVFASDEPWGDFPSEFWKIEGLNIPESEKHKIFYENASKLYFS